jgi:ectoine hydroxylase-related dioxygenase (phytanoyl-CoA dioxygenase family)
VTLLTDGFEITPSVLMPAEISCIGLALNARTLERSRAGARHLMRHAPVRDVAADSRLMAIAQRFLGARAIPFRATLFDKSSAANWLVAWHQDTALPLEQRHDVPGWGPWSIKGGVTYAHAPGEALARVIALRLHLDDSHAANGPLRVLPGTHRFGVLADAQISSFVREVEPIDCTAPAGSIVAMRPLILHASSKAERDDPRRVLHFEYVNSVEIADGLRLAIA